MGCQESGITEGEKKGRIEEQKNKEEMVGLISEEMVGLISEEMVAFRGLLDRVKGGVTVLVEG